MKKKTEIAFALLLVVAIVGVVVVAYLAPKGSLSQTGVWQVATQLTGTGRQDTTEFMMNNPWRVAWSIQKQSENFFFVAVYTKNGTGYSPVAEADEADTNSTEGILPVEYTGSFVIRVLTMNETEWTLQIQEFIEPT
jgi:lipopolysaccharide export LptBFGC system permease protein LptF